MKPQPSMPLYFESLRALLDQFIPAHWPEGNKRNKARNVLATSIAHVTLILPFVPTLIWQGNVFMSIFLLFGVLVAMAVVLVLRYQGSLSVAIAMSVMNNVVLYPGAWFFGGRDDPAFPVFYTLVPVSSTFMLGAGAGMLATVFTVTMAMIMTIAPNYGWFPFDHAPMRNPQLMHAMYLGGTIGGAGVLAVLFQFSKTVSDLALREARRHSEQLAAFRSQFLANMSHEIRTPMNAIIGLSGLALKNDMPERVHDYLTKIQSSAEHLLGIINDVLDISKIESGKLEMESVPFDMESVISNVVSLVSDKVDAKKLEFVCHVDSSIPRTLIGDPLRIGQILINLANNAVKFTQTGEIRISISMQSVQAQQACVRFEVQDTGIGLSAQQMDKLFKSFEQADSSTTREYGGTGLGLAISKSLAEAMGGEIGVRSAPEQGSTFWFTAQLGVGSAERFLPTAPQALRGRRVLVVDDSEAAGLVLADTLIELGFVVDRAISGHVALAMMQSEARAVQPYAFVIVDWLMPDMDGLETIKALQAQHAGERPYILMVTAHRREEVVRGALALGVEHVLSKPVSSSLLFNTLMQLMGSTITDAEPCGVARKESALESQLHRIRGARLLLVEDNEVNQLVASEILSQAGFSVEVAENGKIAVQKVQAQFSAGVPYDLVLMDMQMPVMDGVTATLQLRQIFSADQLPIVAMTANAMQADRERCKAAGMNSFVPKPIDPDDLWAALLALVKAREGIGQSPVQPSKQVQAPAHTLALIEALKRLPVLKVAQGLTYSNNDPALYVTVLRRMIATQEDAVTRITQKLAMGDVASAERDAHTLKGLAGNMGAVSLQKSARKLEAALKTEAPLMEVEITLEDTRQHLQNLVSACKALPEFAPPHSERHARSLTPKERQLAQQTVRTICTMLEQDDARALELWESNAEVLALIYPQAQTIGNAIGSFAFEEALSLLQGAPDPLSA